VAGVDRPIGGERTPDRLRDRRVGAEQRGHGGIESREHLAQLAWRREVLVLVGDPHRLHPLGRRKVVDHGRDEILGGAGPRGDPHDPRLTEGVEVEFARSVDAEHEPAARGSGDLGQRDRVGGVRTADDHDGIGPFRDLGERVLAVGRREAEVVAGGRPGLREPRAGRLENAGPLLLGERGLGEHGDPLGVGDIGRGRRDVVGVFDEPDRSGRHRHCADCLVVARVTRVDDGVALLGPDPGLVVDLRHQGTYGVDDVAVTGAGGRDHLGSGTVGREHERRTGRHGLDVIDEDDSEAFEAVDDEPIVDDLVVAVDGRIEGPDHPGQRLDRHLDPGAEATGLGQEYAFDRHGRRVVVHRPYPVPMPAARVVAVAPGSAAEIAGLCAGDEILSVNGAPVRDVIEYQVQSDGARVELELVRGGLERSVTVEKAEGVGLGIELASPVFDRIRTCDNHCPFCFIYQLPAGMRRSLSVKDDDYRLSFLYGNFTTLTRFTEADFERVITERLSPLYVSIHATDPDLRSRLLRNRRGGTSLRWLEVILAAGIEVHGQIVVCPGVNDGAALDDTLLGILDRFPALATVGIVPLGVSAHNREPEMRPHTRAEAEAVCDLVGAWQDRYRALLGRRLAYVSDEYYLLAGRPFPALADYDGCPQHENGIGMAATFAAELEAAMAGGGAVGTGPRTGFFASVDGAPAVGYRAPRTIPLRVVGAGSPAGSEREGPVHVITGDMGAEVLGPLIESFGLPAHLLPVPNRFFGGNIGVTGLLTGTDIAEALAGAPEFGRYLLPDVCLSQGRFLDGLTPADLPRPVEVVATDAVAFARAVGAA